MSREIFAAPGAGAPRAGPLDCPAPMAVRAHHLTFRDLRVDCGDRRPATGEAADLTRLVAVDMVELEDDEMILAAIAAGLSIQHGDQVRAPKLDPLPLIRPYVTAMLVATYAEVRPEAVAAPMLPTALRVTIEELDRAEHPAPAAPLHIPGQDWEPPSHAPRLSVGHRHVADQNADARLRHSKFLGDRPHGPSGGTELACWNPFHIPPSHERMFAAGPDGRTRPDRVISVSEG